MARPKEPVITEHFDAAQGPASGEGTLCGTAFVGDHAFTFELPASGTVDIGRGEEADVQLSGGGVSREHVRLTMRGERALIEDRGSRNGTFLDGTRLEGRHEIGHGAEVGIGDTRIVLLRRSALPAGAAPAFLRRGFVDRLDRDLAAQRRVAVFTLQLPDRWYALATVRDVVAKLQASTTFAIYNDHVLAFAVGEARRDVMTLVASATLTLRTAGIEVAAGVAPDGAATGEDLLNGALKAMLAAEADEAETAQRPIVLEAAMVRLYDEARRIARSPLSILIIGETGAGKEVFARTIHLASGRTGPLIAVNAAALPEQLMESELFGHEKGAFSGAVGAKVGLIEASHGGTLFLDEIGELPLPMQAKLLRVLEDKAIRRVGATSEKKIDLRVIAATNADLEQAVADKRFRQDLLFRLNGSLLRIPPLRERRAEIARLAEVFLVRAAASMSAPHVRMSPQVTAILEQWSWPGNVRELRNVVERAVALAATGDGVVTPDHLPAAMRGARTSAPTSVPSPSVGGSGSTGPVRDSVRDFERDRIIQALEQCGGNQTKAAEMLGLPRRTLAYKMGRLGIAPK